MSMPFIWFDIWNNKKINTDEYLTFVSINIHTIFFENSIHLIPIDSHPIRARGDQTDWTCCNKLCDYLFGLIESSMFRHHGLGLFVAFLLLRRFQELTFELNWAIPPPLLMMMMMTVNGLHRQRWSFPIPKVVKIAQRIPPPEEMHRPALRVLIPQRAAGRPSII